MPSFRKYLLSHIEEDSPAGDLARDFAEDDCAKGLSSYKSIRKHMEGHNACDAALDALDELNIRFVREVSQASLTSRSSSTGSRDTQQSSRARLSRQDD